MPKTNDAFIEAGNARVVVIAVKPTLKLIAESISIWHTDSSVGTFVYKLIDTITGDTLKEPVNKIKISGKVEGNYKGPDELDGSISWSIININGKSEVSANTKIKLEKLATPDASFYLETELDMFNAVKAGPVCPLYGEGGKIWLAGITLSDTDFADSADIKSLESKPLTFHNLAIKHDLAESGPVYCGKLVNFTLNNPPMLKDYTYYKLEIRRLLGGSYNLVKTMEFSNDGKKDHEWRVGLVDREFDLIPSNYVCSLSVAKAADKKGEKIEYKPLVSEYTLIGNMKDGDNNISRMQKPRLNGLSLSVIKVAPTLTEILVSAEIQNIMSPMSLNADIGIIKKNGSSYSALFYYHAVLKVSSGKAEHRHTVRYNDLSKINDSTGCFAIIAFHTNKEKPVLDWIETDPKKIRRGQFNSSTKSFYYNGKTGNYFLSQEFIP